MAVNVTDCPNADGLADEATAVVVLALAAQAGDEAAALAKRGRAFLVASQQADGSWRETTRPAGRDSYAQRLSTAGWATLALLATAGR